MTKATCSISSLGLLVLLLAFAGCDHQAIESGDTIQRDGQPDVMYVEKGDSEMEQARQKARETVDQFIKALDSPTPSQSHFAIKVPIEENDLVEHMWLNPVRHDAGRFFGVLNNNPVMITTVKAGDQVEASTDEISDWRYIEDGKLVGGYSIRLMHSRLSEAEREAFDQQSPYKIESSPFD